LGSMNFSWRFLTGRNDNADHLFRPCMD
jgi:hypothetical protein